MAFSAPPASRFALLLGALLACFWWNSILSMMVVVLAIGIWFWIWLDADPAQLRPDAFPYDPSQSVPVVGTEEKMLIVGAGFCGLGLAAAFKRHMIPFDLVEADDAIGGNWYHGVYESVHIISSRKTTEYKDFLMPSDWSDFPSAEQMLSYLRSYAEHYNLHKLVELTTKVTQVVPIGKGKDSKGWQVVFASGEERIYKGVVIAIGHHWSKRMPCYPGLENFAGEIMHSKDYRNINQLKGKRVLVIGAGNSGCDIAVEAARFAVSSHVSHRRGYWFLPRCIAGIPLVEFVRPWFPIAVQRLLTRFVLWLSVGPNEKYGLAAPDHELFEHHPTVNSELLNLLRLGRIIPHKDILEIEERTKLVTFIDGQREEFDLIVAATGYNLAFPMLSKDVLPFKDGVPQLMASLVGYNFKHLYVFGIGQVRYGAGPLVTAGAEGVVQIIKAQDNMVYPLADVMNQLGLAKNPSRSTKSADILQDPHTTYMQIKSGVKFFPFLPILEKLLLRLGVLA